MQKVPLGTEYWGGSKKNYKLLEELIVFYILAYPA
jgi:hypothetical protein